MKTAFNIPSGLRVGIAGISVISLAPYAIGAPATWDGGADGTGTELNTGANWSTDSSAFVAGDVATFDGTTSLGTLTWNNTLGPMGGNAGGLVISYTGSGNLTLDSLAAGATLGLDNITIGAGAGAFSLGNGLDASLVVWRAASPILTNNSANTATFGADLLFRHGAGANRGLTFDGTGNWLINAGIRTDPAAAAPAGSFSSITKNGTGTTTLTSGLNAQGGNTINGGTLALSGSGTLGSITGTTTVGTSGTLNLGGTNQTVGGLAGGGAVVNSGEGASILTIGNGVAAGTTHTHAGAIGGGGGGDISLIKTGAGIARLDGNSTFAGGVTLNAGGLHYGHDNALGTGELVVNGGHLAARASARILANNVLVNADFSIGNGDTGEGTASTTFNGSINLGGGVRVITIRDYVTSTDVVFAGDISDGGLTKAGSGVLELRGTAKSYTGTTTVQAGTLLVNTEINSSTVIVNSGATIGGSGSVGGALTVAAGATISPGNSPGNFTVSGGLTLAGAYTWELGALSTANPGVDYDTITVLSGNVDITGALLNLSLGALEPSADPFWAANQAWVILNNEGSGTLTGSFAGIDNTAWVALGEFSAVNVDNDVVLLWTAVPEPGSMALLSLAGGFSLLRRRRRAKASGAQ